MVLKILLKVYVDPQGAIVFVEDTAKSGTPRMGSH